MLLQYRLMNFPAQTGKPLKITEWDAFGYNLYLPSIFIYNEAKALKWCDTIDAKYALSGGTGLPVEAAPNGHLVNKYLCGVAIMQLPFFIVGHLAAPYFHYPQDGYSPPYQYALAFGILLYSLLASLILRRVLLFYFKDFTVAATLLLLCLATNFIQYAAVDSGQSHAYIFLLYTVVLYATIRWHQRPGRGWAALIGYTIGLAMISRPTEAIMLLIPLLWNTHTKIAARAKWALLKEHRAQVFIAGFAGILGILPQLIYWKIVSGSFLFDVGSKWVFFNPWFRVLFGFEKGWFIYTPVTVFFIAGFFFMKQFPFRKAVLTFCLLNIWIIISWDDWQYGGSYSTRALVQSYPVFALPLAALIDRVGGHKWKYVFYPIAVYLLGVNLFQITQYCSTILHFRDMNRRYYSRIYLNPHPTPIDMSLLDTPEFPRKSELEYPNSILQKDSLISVSIEGAGSASFCTMQVKKSIYQNERGQHWLKVEATIIAPDNLWERSLAAELRRNDSVKSVAVRLFNPVGERSNQYAFYVPVPAYFVESTLSLMICSPYNFKGAVKRIQITAY